LEIAMNAPSFETSGVAADTVSLSTIVPVGDLGMLHVNAFVLQAALPILVDTGPAALREPFLAALGRTIDPADLRYVWMSHMDADHLGNLAAVLDLAPQAKVITNFLGMAKMGLLGHDTSRVQLIAPGEELDLGDRRLVPLKPPYYDAPETTGFFDTRTRVLFSADAFGALLPAAETDAAAIDHETLREGMLKWAAIDAPWLSTADPRAFGGLLRNIERLDPSAIISGHLPVARGVTGRLARNLNEALSAGVFDVPDHDTFERLIDETAALAA
jgi:glyoxylase-like metal-dependent hydrolase (beta-lactamase superfamily II)